MPLLEDIKTGLGISVSDVSKDSLLNIYIRKGTTLIAKYMNGEIYGKASLTIGGVKYEAALAGAAGNAYTVTIQQGTGASVATSGVIDEYGNLVITLGTNSDAIALPVTAYQIAALILTGKGSALITRTALVSATVQVVSASQKLTPIILVDIPTVYADALLEYVTLAYRKKGNEGIRSFGQGGRSGTYEDGLQTSVKDLLPAPYIRMARAGRDYYAT